MVAGLMNRKTASKTLLNDIDFVAYEVIIPSDLSAGKQYIMMNSLQESGSLKDVALHELNISPSTLSNEYLSEKLIDWRDNYEYEIDGVIVSHDGVHPRTTDKFPEYAFAFKMVLSEQVVEAKVLDVLWTPSKDGYLKPRVRIEPVNIGGVTIEYATAFNADFVEKNKLGVGAVIQLVRSGDVIPHIMAVISQATKAKMPDLPYEWNDTHIDVVLKNAESNLTVQEKKLVSFFKGLDVTGLSEGNIKRIMKAGFTTKEAILSMTIEDFKKAEGFKDKMATKVYNSLRKKIEDSSLSKLMASSGLFGRGMGERKIKALLEVYPEVLMDAHEGKKSAGEITHIVNGIEGFAKKTSELFVSNIPKFLTFLEKANLMHKLEEHQVEITKLKQTKSKQDTTHPLYDKTVVMTGFRDKELQKVIENVGGKNGSSVSKKTFALLVVDKFEETSKTEKATKYGVQILTPEEFKEKYLN
jgi:NAD-dependent DNA ligase